MKAEYTIKIDGVFYKAGDELPCKKGEKIEETKAATVEKPDEPPIVSEPVEQKRKYTRRK